jgi:hypothetical protein
MCKTILLYRHKHVYYYCYLNLISVRLRNSQQQYCILALPSLIAFEIQFSTPTNVFVCLAELVITALLYDAVSISLIPSRSRDTRQYESICGMHCLT